MYPFSPRPCCKTFTNLQVKLDGPRALSTCLRTANPDPLRAATSLFIDNLCQAADGGGDVISPDESCDADVDVCTQGYRCISGRCRHIILPGEPCDTGDVCLTDHSCIDGVCAVEGGSYIPAGGACVAGTDVCVDGLACTDGYCSTARWYTNWSYCMMDCPTSAGGCCGGYAQSYDATYETAEGCCGQSALQWKYQECMVQSTETYCSSSDGEDANVVEGGTTVVVLE